MWNAQCFNTEVGGGCRRPNKKHALEVKQISCDVYIIKYCLFFESAVLTLICCHVHNKVVRNDLDAFTWVLFHLEEIWKRPCYPFGGFSFPGVLWVWSEILYFWIIVISLCNTHTSIGWCSNKWYMMGGTSWSGWPISRLAWKAWNEHNWAPFKK